jgi:hypothetical protein
MASSTYFITILTFARRQQVLIIAIILSILLLMLMITFVLCFVDRLQKKISRKTSSMLTNGLIHASPYHQANGKRIAKSLPRTKRHKHKHDDTDDSPTHNYTSLKCLKPIIVVDSSSSPSVSVDSMTRSNTTHNRTLTNTYTYTAIATHDDLRPLDFDDYRMPLQSDIELMMTTV